MGRDSSGTGANKSWIVQNVVKSTGGSLTEKEARKVVDVVITALKQGVKKSKSVSLVGFGTFKVATRKAKTGRNPKTGEKIKIKASKTVKFSASKGLKTII